jgi:hypothetical protein
MKKTAYELQPNLVRLALGIPTAGVGGLLGYLTAPKAHRWEGAARGAGVGYMAGTGAGIGATLGEAAAPDNNSTRQNVPYMMSGGLAGGILGMGVGQMMQGTPPWVRQQKFRDELLNVLKEEQNKLRKELKGEHPVHVLQKMGSEKDQPALVEFASENPELATISTAGLIGAGAAKKKRHPLLDLLRGGLTGVTTGAGAVAGGMAGRSMSSDDPSGGALVGGGLGGLLSYLAARQAFKGIGSEKTALSPALKTLIEAKELSDRKDYKGKHVRLRSLIEQFPDDFFIDSLNGDIAGITHRPTGFKIHAPLKVLPVNLRGFPNVETRVA